MVVSAVAVQQALAVAGGELVGTPSAPVSAVRKASLRADRGDLWLLSVRGRGDETSMVTSSLWFTNGIR